MSKEFPQTDKILALSAVLFFGIWILDSFFLKTVEILTWAIPDSLKAILFVGLELSAALLGWRSHEALFDGKKEKFTLIVDGAFAHVRHPLYLSILLFYLGFVFGSMSLVSFILWIGYVILFDKMATFEEEDLMRIFGESYAAYKKRTPKWIPRVTAPRNEKCLKERGN